MISVAETSPAAASRAGTLTKYEPFPGIGEGVDESADLGVSVANFTFANTGELLPSMATGDGLAMATVKIGRVHIDTPDLGRMEVFQGNIGDLAVTRMAIQGEVRNIWKSLNVRWPYYSYQDRCAWRFGGAGCGFNTTSITITGSTVTGSCTTLVLHTAGTVVSTYNAGRFNFGRITITGGVNSGEIRTVRIHSGALIHLSHALPVNSFTGLRWSMFPGCNKRFINDCKSLYNNTENFLAFPWIPIQEEAF